MGNKIVSSANNMDVATALEFIGTMLDEILRDNDDMSYVVENGVIYFGADV